MNTELEQIEKTMQAIANCDTTTLTAVLAMLPDAHEDGTAIVLAAAARIIAERFEDAEDAMAKLGELVNKNKEIIDENKLS